MSTEVNTKTAIVTGGTRGIGKAISQRLIGAGYRVYAVYSGNVEAAKKFEQETGGKALQLDVTDYDKSQSVIEKILSETESIEVLVNNAGITRDGMLHKSELDSWKAVIDTNLNACYNLCRAVVPAMRTARFGRIINISSINGQKGQLGQANYSAAKAGMLGFTKALALESAGRGITVNAICPGYINTDMTADMPHEILESIVKQIPAGRLGKPEEIAEMVAYLSSDLAGFVNGATFAINGGQYMS